MVSRGDEQRYADVSLIRSEPPAPAGENSGLIERISRVFAPVSMARWIPAPRFGAVPEEIRIAREAWQQPAFGFYRWFADYPALYRVDRGNPSQCAWFEDLRFTMPGRGNTPFRYGMCRDGDGPWLRYRLIGDRERVRLE